jgi:photosynthetic reaction center cytochrome c subunit
MLRIQSRTAGAAIALIAASLVATLGALSQDHAAKPQPQTEGKTAAQAFKNVQVLQNIPASQLIPAMQFIAASLGVECEYCHVEGKFESDDKKPKATAREMMKMMITINQENFDGKREVTCYSCHRGSTRPVATPIIPDQQQASATNTAPEGEASANKTAPKIEDLLSKYIQASGGEAAISKITSRTEAGNLTLPDGQSSPVNVLAKAPDKRAVITHGKRGDSVTAFDGQVGWMGAPGRPARVMSPADSEATRVDADLHLPLDLKNLFTAFRVDGVEKIGDSQARVVIAERNDKLAAKLYFDEKSGLLVRIMHFIDSPLGYNPVQIDFADYRDTDGVKVPFRWTLARPSGRFTIQLDSVQQNVPVPDTSFAQPKPSDAQTQ